MPYYTGVGSRKTPNEILSLMTTIAGRLSQGGYVLRSGAAIGADSAFEMGAGQKQIFLTHHTTSVAMELAGRFHPAWDRCSEFAKKLHGRNAFQVLGPNLNEPSTFLICWTPDGCTSHFTRQRATGGTGTAISIAEAYGIPIHNLAIESHLKTWVDWLTLPHPPHQP